MNETRAMKDPTSAPEYANTLKVALKKIDADIAIGRAQIQKIESTILEFMLNKKMIKRELVDHEAILKRTG